MKKVPKKDWHMDEIVSAINSLVDAQEKKKQEKQIVEIHVYVHQQPSVNPWPYNTPNPGPFPPVIYQPHTTC